MRSCRAGVMARAPGSSRMYCSTRLVSSGAAATRVEQYMRLLPGDRKSTRLNSSHSQISYAVFCLKKKKTTQDEHRTPTQTPHKPLKAHTDRTGYRIRRATRPMISPRGARIAGVTHSHRTSG